MSTISTFPAARAAFSAFKATPIKDGPIDPPASPESYTPQPKSDKPEESRLKVYSTFAMIGAVAMAPVLLGALTGPFGAILGAGALTALTAYNYEDNSEYHDKPFNAMGTFAGLTAMGLVGSSFGVGVGLGAVALGSALGISMVAAFDKRLFH